MQKIRKLTNIALYAFAAWSLIFLALVGTRSLAMELLHGATCV